MTRQSVLLLALSLSLSPSPFQVLPLGLSFFAGISPFGTRFLDTFRPSGTD
jgi:hypothetical protein